MQESNKPQAEEQELIQVSGETSELSVSKDGDEATSQSEITPSLEQLLKEAELRATEHHDAWLRAKAEADNIRKRAQSDIANAHKYAIEKFSSELLAVMDSLEAALTVENATLENFKKWCGTNA